MRLLIIQWGDYAEAELRFARGGGETYYAQRYTVGYVASLVRAGASVRVLSIGADAPLQRLPSGVESLGLKLWPGRFRGMRRRKLIHEAEEWKPTHLALMIPLASMLRWAQALRIETLPFFADSFYAKGLRQRLRYRQLAKALNAPSIRWVVNHGPNAAADLVRIGVDPRKVLPFDWPSFASPADRAPKKAPSDPHTVRLVYVGSLTVAKGVGDLIEAVAVARAQAEDYRVVIVGSGDEARFRKLAAKLDVAASVEFAGRVTHERVLEIMNQGDVVVVPSRHGCPEGMPMTVYEGLSSRSPVAISDHPMFRGRVIHRQSGMIFQAASPKAIVDSVRELVGDRALYERLSADADKICAQFFGPLKWHEVMDRWLRGGQEDDEWLRQFALAH